MRRGIIENEQDKGRGTTMSNVVLETRPVAKIKGNFLVPSYQRGYRWKEDEVTRLLDDVYQNRERNYCLQPIVVQREGNEYELIDGQQRLTTLYLIYKYMADADTSLKGPGFTLSYETREKSKFFLENLEKERRDENIDFFFISNAYETIQIWFKEDIKGRVETISNSFNEHVKVIWYEVGEGEDGNSIFTRLNIGKIPLTNAELVKAMFLSRDANKDMEKEKQNEISLQWDDLEKELHNKSLWYFLTNSIEHDHETRIDLVLDLISGRGGRETHERYFTFFEFDKRLKNGESLGKIWEDIYQTFLILKGWYENHTLYHRIGYLIASNSNSLGEVFKLSKGRRKDEFETVLDESIRKSVKINGNYADLDYLSNNAQISRLLLLFNVESVRQADNQTQRFPFDRFKRQRNNKATWSLEHIHAQQSETINKKAWNEWIGLHIPSIESIGGDNGELISRMQRVLGDDKTLEKEFYDIQKKVEEKLSIPGTEEYMHSIANLALLNTADNAALNNSAFDVKRNKIIEMDKKGQYIPFCTKMVFLKYYTPSEDNQLHFWGPADRMAYVGAINEVLGEYIEPITIEEEKAK